jgi:hypothetical protein
MVTPASRTRGNSAVPFEKLHGSLVLLGGGSSWKSAEVAPTAVSGINLA